MTIDNTTVSAISLAGVFLGLAIQIIVQWNKLRGALTSGKAVTVFEIALILGCFHFGPWAVMIGAYVYMTLVTIDFIRNRDTSCGAIGSAIMTTANGIFTFAIQFAYLIKSA